MSRPLEGVLLGSVIIVATGAVDDVVSLKAWVKLLLQIAAACVAVYYGVRIEVLGNLNIFSSNDYVTLASWSVPITVLWIVGITNSVNLIDGLDGLAVGVSTISSLTMLVIALLVADSSVAVVLAALVGACIGFMRECGIAPQIIPIRGGTDGAKLSFRGLPCPNLGTGGGNYHGPFEFCSLTAMEKTVEVLVRLTALFAEQEKN